MCNVGKQKKIEMKFKKYCIYCANRKMVHLFKNEVPEGKNPILLTPVCKVEENCIKTSDGIPSLYKERAKEI